MTEAKNNHSNYIDNHRTMGVSFKKLNYGLTMDNHSNNHRRSLENVGSKKVYDSFSPAKQAQSDKATRIADELLRRFGAPNSYKFFLKCGWRLSEDFIWTTYEQAHGKSVKQPLFYFVAVCNRKMSGEQS